MGKLTRETITNIISDKIGCKTYIAKDVTNAIVESFIEHLVNGDVIELRGLGTLYSKDFKKRRAMDIYHNKEVHIDAMKRVKFKPSKKFLKILNSK